MEKISWEAFEYKQKQRTTDWYWAVIVITLAIFIISIVLHDALFGILILIGAAILVLFSIREPRLFRVTMDKRGITAHSDVYPFATLEEFWVDISEEDSPKILLKSKKTFSPLIVIPISDYDHLDIRDFLLQYLPENEIHEPLSQKIMERLGF